MFTLMQVYGMIAMAALPIFALGYTLGECQPEDSTR